MMKSPLRKLIRSKFESTSLSEQQQEQLGSLLKQFPKRPRVNRRGLTAALLALGVGVYFNLPRKQLPGTELPVMIAEQLAEDYVGMKPLEIETDSIAEVREYFGQLEFSPIHSRERSLSSSRLLGGRYCGVRGKMAVELHYIDDHDALVTLHQTKYLPAVFSPNIPDIDRGHSPLTLYSRGLKVTLWVENGLFVAKTSVLHEEGEVGD